MVYDLSSYVGRGLQNKCKLYLSYWKSHTLLCQPSQNQIWIQASCLDNNAGFTWIISTIPEINCELVARYHKVTMY
jgi:hypothetical protein